MEFLLLGIFAAGLLACVFSGISVLYAMAFGFLLFFGYGLKRGKSAKEMAFFAMSGVKTVKNILITFVLIGVITAVWRACGAIACIVYYASALCMPSVMLLASFLMCCLVSFLTGTSFGSAATIGVICMTMSRSMGIPEFYAGGAILAGVYFGDRCSPVSTSALLVSEVTGTNLYSNIKKMMRTAAVPFAVTCAAYAVLGMSFGGTSASAGTREILAENFSLSPLTLLPVAAVIILAVCRVNVKITLAVSSLCGVLAAVCVQKTALTALPELIWNGFSPESGELARLMQGGGVVSIVQVFCIVCVSSSYSGMFNGTGFLNSAGRLVSRLGEKMTPFGSVLITSAVSAAVACNQTLAIMLTNQLCGPAVKRKEDMASYLENSAVVVSPLVPWSVAGAVPLASVGAPKESVLFAFYLFLIPLWTLGTQAFSSRKTAK